jgi:hypothetical protein
MLRKVERLELAEVVTHVREAVDSAGSRTGRRVI